jgi:hydrogenase nickel incorporation protein HypA/HybF
MHELSVTQNLLELVLNEAKKAEAKRVTQINLVIGDVATVIDNSVQFYFDFISKGTISEGAVLSFRRIPIIVKCRSCGQTFSPSEQAWHCPNCQKWDAEIIAGKEFYLESIEIE